MRHYVVFKVIGVPGVVAFALAAVVLLSAFGAAAARADAPPAASSAVDPLQWCAVALRSVIPVAPGGDAASTYLLDFAARGSSGLSASGVASVFAGDDRYDIAFQDADVRPLHNGYAGTVLAVHFATPIRLDGGYVSRLGGPGGGSCAANGPAFSPNGPIPVRYAAPIQTPDPRNEVQVTAPSPTHDPLPACTVPYAEAETTHFAPLQIPGAVTVSSVSVRAGVRVRIAPDGNFIDANVTASSPFPAFDEAVVRAAEHSTYAPAVFRCNAVGGEYLFVGIYDPPQE